MRRGVQLALVVALGGLLVFSSGACGSGTTFVPGPLGPSPVLQWLLTGSLSNARRDMVAVVLGNGTVLVVGGNTAPNVAQLYDPATGMFSTVGSMTSNRTVGHSATLLDNGTVLVVGGQGTGIQTAEIYDPATMMFTPTAGAPTGAHAGHVAVKLVDGRVLLAGGRDAMNNVTGVAEIYDPATGMFTATNVMGVPRNASLGVLLGNGTVLVAAGVNAANSGVNDCELWNPANGMWTATGAMGLARSAPRGVVLPDGRVLATGRINSAVAETYDPMTGMWSNTAGPMTVTRQGHSVALLPSGQVLLAGGAVMIGPVVTDSAELFDPTTNTFTATVSMNERRQQATMVVLPSGLALMIGGTADMTGDTATAELYGPQ